jgi:hypothetical protein
MILTVAVLQQKRISPYGGNPVSAGLELDRSVGSIRDVHASLVHAADLKDLERLLDQGRRLD